jgi:hypothetical protein
MDNPEKLATLNTQDRGRRQTIEKKHYRKLKRSATHTLGKPRGEPTSS